MSPYLFLISIFIYFPVYRYGGWKAAELGSREELKKGGVKAFRFFSNYFAPFFKA